MTWFKSMTINAYIRGIKEYGWPAFAGRLWQRSFYEHIVRDERGLDSVREYILNNPAKWSADRENPAAISIPKAQAAWQV